MGSLRKECLNHINILVPFTSVLMESMDKCICIILLKRFNDFLRQHAHENMKCLTYVLHCAGNHIQLIDAQMDDAQDRQLSARRRTFSRITRTLYTIYTSVCMQGRSFHKFLKQRKLLVTL